VVKSLLTFLSLWVINKISIKDVVMESPSIAYSKLFAFGRELDSIKAGSQGEVSEEVVAYFVKRIGDLKKVVP